MLPARDGMKSSIGSREQFILHHPQVLIEVEVVRLIAGGADLNVELGLVEAVGIEEDEADAEYLRQGGEPVSVFLRACLRHDDVAAVGKEFVGAGLPKGGDETLSVDLDLGAGHFLLELDEVVTAGDTDTNDIWGAPFIPKP